MQGPQRRESRVTSSTTDWVPATAPAVTSECPLRDLVALVMTTSAPCSRGRKLIGDAKVLSTSSANPYSLAIEATGTGSTTRITGLVGDSKKMARVVFRMARRQARGWVGSTYVTAIPNRSSSSSNNRRVPP